MGDRSGKRFTLGDALRVAVVNVEPPQGKIELKLSPVTKKPSGRSNGGRNAGPKVKSSAETSEKSMGGKAKGKAAGAGAAEKTGSKASKNTAQKKHTTPTAVKRKRKNNG